MPLIVCQFKRAAHQCAACVWKALRHDKLQSDCPRFQRCLFQATRSAAVDHRCHQLRHWQHAGSLARPVTSSSFSIALLIFQATFYALSAAVSAFLFVKWRQADADAKSRIWRRYGLFTALMCVGSCGGVLAASATIQDRYYFARINHGKGTCSFFQVQCIVDEYADVAQILAQTTYWLSVRQVPLAIEFMCLCFAKLLVRFMPFCAIAFSCPRPRSCLNEW